MTCHMLAIYGRYALAECFADATIIEHPGAHCIPSGPAVRQQLGAWLSDKGIV